MLTWNTRKTPFINLLVLSNSEKAILKPFAIFLNGQTIPIPVQAQRVLIMYFCFFFKDNKAHNVHDNDVHYQNSIIKPHTL